MNLHMFCCFIHVYIYMYFYNGCVIIVIIKFVYRDIEFLSYFLYIYIYKLFLGRGALDEFSGCSVPALFS